MINSFLLLIGSRGVAFCWTEFFASVVDVTIGRFSFCLMSVLMSVRFRVKGVFSTLLRRRIMPHLGFDVTSGACGYAMRLLMTISCMDASYSALENIPELRYDSLNIDD